MTSSRSFQCSSALQGALRKFETRAFMSRRPELCTNEVPSRSIQKPLRLSRDADRRTDRQTDGFSALYSTSNSKCTCPIAQEYTIANALSSMLHRRPWLSVEQQQCQSIRLGNFGLPALYVHL